MNRKIWGTVGAVALTLLVLSAFGNSLDPRAAATSSPALEKASIDWSLAVERVVYYAKDTLAAVRGESGKYYGLAVAAAILLAVYGAIKSASRRRGYRSTVVRRIPQKLSTIHSNNLGHWARRTGVGRDGVRLLLSKPAWQELPE